MSGWIKWEKDLETDIRFTRLCRHVRDTCNAGALRERFNQNAIVTLTIGSLMKMWSYADTHIRADDTLDLSFDDIDELVGLVGFAASLPEDWLIKRGDQCVELPGFQEHNGTVAKKRDLNTKRQQRHRALQKTDDVTHERDNRNAGALPDQTRPDQTKPKKKRSADAPVVPFDPKSIQGLDVGAWLAWVAYRAERKPPIKPVSMQAAAEELAAFGAEQAAVVRHSKANGYQGLIAPKANGARVEPPPARRAREFGT